MASLTNDLDPQEREKLLRHLKNIRADKDTDRACVSGWLHFLLSKQDEKNRKADGPELYRSQGKAQLLTELIHTIDSSLDQLKALEPEQ